MSIHRPIAINPMLQPLGSQNKAMNEHHIRAVVKEVDSYLDISSECSQFILQLLTPLNDLLENKDNRQLISLVEIYFPSQLAEHAINEIDSNNDTLPHHSSQFLIINYLIGEIVESSGIWCRKRHDSIIQFIDVQEAIACDEELKIMFQQWLFPTWIFRDPILKSLNDRISSDNLKTLFQITLPNVTYEDKIQDCINDILDACVILSLKYPKEAEYFYANIPVPSIPQNLKEEKRLRVLGLILGCFVYKNHVTFTDLIMAVKFNPFYPKFINFLNLSR
jgi:hypothetical protein